MMVSSQCKALIFQDVIVKVIIREPAFFATAGSKGEKTFCISLGEKILREKESLQTAMAQSAPLPAGRGLFDTAAEVRPPAGEAPSCAPAAFEGGQAKREKRSLGKRRGRREGEARDTVFLKRNRTICRSAAQLI